MYVAPLKKGTSEMYVAPIFRVTRYPMIFKTESGRVSNEIPGIGSGSGTRWALHMALKM